MWAGEFSVRTSENYPHLSDKSRNKLMSNPAATLTTIAKNLCYYYVFSCPSCQRTPLMWPWFLGKCCDCIRRTSKLSNVCAVIGEIGRLYSSDVASATTRSASANRSLGSPRLRNSSASRPIRPSWIWEIDQPYSDSNSCHYFIMQNSINWLEKK